MLNKRVCWRRGATGLLNKGGGSNRLPGLVTKQQAVEFPQVLTSAYNFVTVASEVVDMLNVGGRIFSNSSLLRGLLYFLLHGNQAA